MIWLHGSKIGDRISPIVLHYIPVEQDCKRWCWLIKSFFDIPGFSTLDSQPCQTD